MRYKALIVDVDGTLIPNKEDGKPSARVKSTIAKAQSKIHIGIASGRPLYLLKDIFAELKLSGPSIIYGGAQVVDSRHHNVLWEKSLSQEQMRKVYDLVFPITGSLSSDETFADKQLSKDHLPQKAYTLYTGKISITLDRAREVVKALRKVPDVVGHIIPGWDGDFAVNITHAQATKQHGIYEVAKILGIETHEIIGIGDGGNDFPLLMACGLKVAMGNADESLKEIADYIAPSVDNDGVADAIEKFILKEQNN